MDSQLLFQIQNGLILGLIYTGVAFRRQRSLHVKLMSSAIIWDILLILQIELTRQAIDTAMKAPTNPWLVNFHIAIAVATVLLYVVMFYTGTKLLKNDQTLRPWHKRAGLLALLFRTSTFVTSFMVAQPQTT